MMSGFYNREQEVKVTKDSLPHWHQDGVYCSITWRMADSLPVKLLDQWKARKEEWILDHPKPWNEEEHRHYKDMCFDTVDKWLDQGTGSCVLKNGGIRRIIESAFHYFDGVRYDLVAYVVMPNHVHCLVKLKENHLLPHLVKSWKQFTAKEINRVTHKKEKFWQKGYYDRLIRGENHYNHAIQYIIDNPQYLPRQSYSLFVNTEGGVLFPSSRHSASNSIG